MLEMFERGADLIECQEGVRPGKNRRILDQEKDDNERRPRYVKLLSLEEQWEARMDKLKSLEAALELGEWSVALYEINRRHRRKEILLGLRAALTSKVWHVVIYLIRQGIGPRLCDGLFSLMVEIQQWDVCRVLLEEGVDLQLGLAALPQLMEQNQWTLVARLMEYDVGDALRRRVMQQALDRREGSVVWQCIINMEHDHLSVEERQELFHEAFNRENWQAVKPLVEVKDDTGIQHRDAALLESIEQHQWDVVDHCLLFRAKINMLDEDRHTPNHRMARKKDWEAVEELTKRRGDPNLLDKDGASVFHRVILAQQRELTKLLIEYLGDIHQSARNYVERRTPLQMLIDFRQVEAIQHTLMWSPDQGDGVNDVGETALHVACLAGCPGMLYDLLARHVQPRVVTRRGHSALSYAVMCRDRPQQTVAECIRLGFSTHEPHLNCQQQNFIEYDSYSDTDSEDQSDSGSDSGSERGCHITHTVTSPAHTANAQQMHTANTAAHTANAQQMHTANTAAHTANAQQMHTANTATNRNSDDTHAAHSLSMKNTTTSVLSSPLLLAVMRGLPRVTQMLYESGACSNTELFRLQATLQELSDPVKNVMLGLEFQHTLNEVYKHVRSDADRPEKADRACVLQCIQYLMEVSTTPRSLQSMCRHVISQSLRLHKNRALDVIKLPLGSCMKRYVVFADLTDPDYGRGDVYRQRREEFVSRHLSEALSALADGDGPCGKTAKTRHVTTGARRVGGKGHADINTRDEDDEDTEGFSDDQLDQIRYRRALQAYRRAGILPYP